MKTFDKLKQYIDAYSSEEYGLVEVKLLTELSTEIERLMEENRQRAINTKCESTIFNEACLTVGIVKALGELEKQKKENAELQKQVDELTAFKNEAISMSLYGKGRKDREEVAVKDTAKKFASLVEFHSVSTRDENGREIFTISALGLKEILHEEFGIPYDEIAKEITEGNNE